MVWPLLLNWIKPGKTGLKGEKQMQLREEDVVLTTEEAIEYLKISRPTFLKYIRLGRIRATKAGSGWRIHKSQLYRFLNVEGDDLL